ncbi:MAG: hypothetical protein ACQESN_11805, partial [Thermotogota bacterium]
MYIKSEIIDWLLAGDISVQYQMHRDIFCEDKLKINRLQSQIHEKGWGNLLMSKRDPKTKLWGNGLYSPKWISTHYTLLELKNMGIKPDNAEYIESAILLLNNMWFNKGKVSKYKFQDMCVAAMILSITTYSKIKSEKIYEIIDYIMENKLTDGGWNCFWERGSKKSSLHTTISVLEAIRDYLNNNYEYKKYELKIRKKEAEELLLRRRIFKKLSSDEIIKPEFTRFPYPSRWKYNFLRALDYFQSVDKKYDPRMNEAINLLLKKRNK